MSRTLRLVWSTFDQVFRLLVSRSLKTGLENLASVVVDQWHLVRNGWSKFSAMVLIQFYLRFLALFLE
jgi:glutathionyl-hydroquinone reductase